ncbi:ATP-binding protein [Streptomyces sp. NPDC020412]|uniref:ATP-binding protein n=1 Tax=Streptomyces sp. NPDC020412 TaxID=3365073 RepID=UPI0037A3BED2
MESVPVPAPRNQVLPDQPQAVRAALSSIREGTQDVDSGILINRVMEAWRRRTTGGSLDGPSVVLVGGFAGSGKSEFAKFLGGLTGWPILDKGSLTRPLVDQLLIALGGEAHDRSSELYREKVRPLEYRCRSKRVSVATIWVECDQDSMREYLEFRGAARDAWKLQAWDEYVAGLDMTLRPQGPHFVVDNRLGVAVALVDEAKDILSGGGL